ncbi:MAG: radical SAM protein [Deltaproteobacteria bacterium]|nr:radical SAM protein [Deltaproteobacteria bacterium]
MTDVTLIYPPSYFVETKNAEDLLKNYNMGKTKIGVWPPLGLLHIAASSREQGISVDFIDAFVLGLSLDELMERIDRNRPKVVGISATTMQIRAAVQIAERIKAKYGDSIYVGIGGPHISIDSGFSSRFSCFDFGVIGEGEVTFPKIVKEILSGNAPKKIYRGEMPEDLDALPRPAREMTDILDYFPVEDPYVTLLTMRGCPFKCIFCSRIAVSDKLRFRKAVSVVDEIEMLMKQYKVKSFVFLDDTFTLKKSHTMELCNEIIARGLKIKWSCNTRANTIDEELVQKMKEAGCNLILIGVESGDERFRNEVVNKKINDKDIANLRKWCRKYKIPLGCYLMLGFPGETMTEINKSVDFAVRFDMDLMSIHTTTVYPGSKLHEHLAKEGKIDVIGQWDKYAKGELGAGDLSLMYIPEGLTLKDLQKARKKAYLKFYFRPKIIAKQFMADVGSFRNLKRDALTAWQLLKHGRTSKDLK